jgi:predicted AlkP superfamily pyrophosphatase or phosphodiesterase
MRMIVFSLVSMALVGCGSRTEPALPPEPSPVEAQEVVPTSLAQHGNFNHVVIVSVDGLRGDAIMALDDPEAHLVRIAARAGTLNARTDPHMTVTLPNHASMMTGRLVRGPDGHGWEGNGTPEEGQTIHDNAGKQLASVFDVAKQAGVRTALIAGKKKFVLFEEGFAAGLDMSLQVDPLDASLATEALLSDLPDADRSLHFVHYALTDYAGHGFGWDLTPESSYLTAVVQVDREIGRIIAAIDADAGLAGSTALIITADHGGGAPHESHEKAEFWINYVIPFMVRAGEPVGDLYELNAKSRTNPGIGQGESPIRNSDAANLALDLLGLDAIPGSTVNADQDLAVLAP